MSRNRWPPGGEYMSWWAAQGVGFDIGRLLDRCSKAQVFTHCWVLMSYWVTFFVPRPQQRTKGPHLKSIGCQCHCSATPPVQRRPVPGHSMEDNDADLFDEYHGDILHHEVRDPGTERDRDLFAPPTEPPRLHVRQRHRNMHRRTRSTELRFVDLIPDLSETIDTDFVALGRDRRASNGSEFDASAWSSCEEKNTRTSNCSAGLKSAGFNFSTLFEERYAEHRKMLVERDAYMRSKRRSTVERHSETDVFEEHGSVEDLRTRRSYSLGTCEQSVSLSHCFCYQRPCSFADLLLSLIFRGKPWNSPV